MTAFIGMFVGGFCAGMLVGLIFGPDSEREHSAKVDGWLAGYDFARTRASHQQERDRKVGETIAMDETTQRATEILARHCEYMGFPESGQYNMKTSNALEAVKEALSTRPTDPDEDKVEALLDLLRRIEPHLDAIICYASTMGEHEPNRIAHDVRAAISAMGHTPPSGEDG